MQPYLRLMWIFLVTALLGFLMDWRLASAGNWQPVLPDTVGVWTSERRTIPKEELEILGQPKYASKEYSNPFGDFVGVSVLAASSMDTYHDPRSCSVGSGYTLTGEILKPLIQKDGKTLQARGLVFYRKTEEREERVIMYYWLQNNDGTTNTEGAIHHDIVARLASVRTIFSTVTSGRKTCVIRIWSPVPPGDLWGERTRRNVSTLACAVYTELEKNRQ